MLRVDPDPQASARFATGDDLEVLCELARGLYGALADQRGGPVHMSLSGRPEPYRDSFAADQADPQAIVVVGVFAGVPVGFTVVRLVPTNGEDVIASMSEIYTEPDARGVGVGEAMLDFAIAWACERGAIGIDAVALPGMRDTKNFFERFGLTARSIAVYRSLR
jgi:GNAT superfamily N-acetyltransferase